MSKQYHLCIVVVIYHQHYHSTKTFQSLLSLQSFLNERNCHVIIYDNSEQPQLENNNYGFIHFQYFHDRRNIGVIPAYQFAMDYSLENNISWLLRLDQDSFFDQSLFDCFYKVAKTRQNYAVIIPKICCKESIISPTYIRLGGIYKAVERRITGEPQKAITYINSMSFINLTYASVRNAVKNAVFYLDISDHEFASKIPYSHVFIMDIIVNHELSVKDVKNIGQKRYYSIIRNEKLFILKTESFLGVIVYYTRLFIRILKLVYLGRYDLSAVVLNSFFH